ncbi:MAG: hypothetical protein V1719_01165 [Patescibacteria group bacterium]
MAIIISKSGKNAQKIDQSRFEQEDALQKYIYENPGVIPLYDIKDNARPIILAREYPTESGPIDAFAIDTDGDIYLIETKLYQNPDKRRVVAQVLDYGASLWKHDTDWEEFTAKIEQEVKKHFNQGLFERLQDELGLDVVGAQQLWDNVRIKLDDSSYKFVVLMDHLDDRLKDLIGYLNQNSKFDIYAVELEYYKFNDLEIVIPKLFGAGTKKQVTSRSQQPIPSDDDFLAAYDNSITIKQYLALFNSISDGQLVIPGISTKITPKFLTFNVGQYQGHKVRIQLCINPEYEGSGLQFWADQVVAKNTQEIIQKLIPKAKLLPLLEASNYKLAKWEWSQVDIATLEDLLKQLAKEII